MNPTQAINIIKQACASVTANLEVHNQIQQAIQVVESKLECKPESKLEDNETKEKK